jgi:hypothetical protein
MGFGFTFPPVPMSGGVWGLDNGIALFARGYAGRVEE